jgi:serine/threonine protein kinase
VRRIRCRDALVHWLQNRGAVQPREELGRYRLLEPIGRGGMATVFAGEHNALRRPVAIKVLHPHLTDDSVMARRILTEACTIAALHHPGLVEIFDVGVTTDGRTFLVMERLNGEPLSERLLRGRLTEERAVVFARQLASVLEVAHAAGVIHRDLKPENVFLVVDTDVSGGERVKLLDFGIAKHNVVEHERTRSGMVLGTPAYMAPEQCSGTGEIDARTDVYALGVLIYRMVTGILPFAGTNTDEILAEHAFCRPAPAAMLAPVSAAFSVIIDRCLAKRPADRFASMAELGAALRALNSATAPRAFDEEPTAVDDKRPVGMEIGSRHTTQVQTRGSNPNLPKPMLAKIKPPVVLAAAPTPTWTPAPTRAPTPLPTPLPDPEPTPLPTPIPLATARTPKVHGPPSWIVPALVVCAAAAAIVAVVMLLRQSQALWP